MSSNLSEPKNTSAFPFTWHTMNGRPKHCKNGGKICKDVLSYFYHNNILVWKTKGAEMQVKLTLNSSASFVTLFSLSLIGWDLARVRISSTSLAERPAFNPACAKQKDMTLVNTLKSSQWWSTMDDIKKCFHVYSFMKN